jgi:hypothetical protein
VLFIEKPVDLVGMILDSGGPLDRTVCSSLSTLRRSLTVPGAIDRVAGDHGLSAALVVVGAVQLVRETDEYEEGDCSDNEAQNEDYNGKGDILGVLLDKIIGQHLDHQGDQSREAVHDCKTETRRDGEYQLSYELINE